MTQKNSLPDEISPYYYLEEELYGNNLPAPNPPSKSLPAGYLYYNHCGFSYMNPSEFTVNCNFTKLEIVLLYSYGASTNKYSFTWELFLEANNRCFLVDIYLESLSSVKEIYKANSI